MLKIETKKRKKNEVNKLRLLKTELNFGLLLTDLKASFAVFIFFFLRFLTAESDRFGLIDLQ